MFLKKHRISDPGGGRGQELWTLTVTPVCQRPIGQLPSPPPATQRHPPHSPCPSNAQSWPLCPNNPQPLASMSGFRLRLPGSGPCLWEDLTLGGRNSGRKEKVTYRLNAPDCKLSPDKGPGHTKSSTQPNSLSPSPQTPSPGQAPSS